MGNLSPFQRTLGGTLHRYRFVLDALIQDDLIKPPDADVGHYRTTPDAASYVDAEAPKVPRQDHA